MAEVKRSQSDGGSGSAGSTVADNVIPIALTGVGVAWLISNIRNAGSAPAEGADQRASRTAAPLRLVQGAQRATSAVAKGAKRTAGGVATGVSHSAHRVHTGYDAAMRDNPLALSAVALAIGALVGLLLPVTRRENELLGDVRDNLIDRAQAFASDVASEAVQSAQQVTDRVKNEASRALNEEVRRQGILAK
jgi:hypothetical protein